MENRHLKATDGRIELGIVGLRALAMPDPPEGLAARMVDADAPSRQRPSRAWKAVAVCVCVGLGLLVAMPQRSSAAEALDRVVSTHQRSNVMFHLTSYWIEGKVRTRKIWSGYVKGDRWRYVQENYEQASDGKRVTTYLPNEGRVLVWWASPSDSDAKSVLADADLSWWKSSERKGLTLEHNVSWNGRRVDRYVVKTTSKDWGETTSILYADPVADLPLYAESIHASGDGSALQWDYLTPRDERLLEIRPKAGVKVEDVTAQRERERLSNAGDPQSAKASMGGGP